jgi:hypothetical protein
LVCELNLQRVQIVSCGNTLSSMTGYFLKIFF